MSYEPGSLYRFTLAVTDASGQPLDAATQTVTVTLPDSTTAIPIVSHDGTGAYHADYQFVQEGLHKFQGVTTGPVTSKTDWVPVNAFRSVISIDEGKLFVNYDISTDREDILRLVLAAATGLAESIAGTCVQRTLTNVHIPGQTRSALLLPFGPLPSETAVTSISSVYTGGPVWTTANGDLIVSPESATVSLLNYGPFWNGPWRATYTAGRQIIPVTIQLAVKEIIYDLWSTQRAYGANELEPGPEATARFEQMVAQYSYPAHAKALLESHALPGFG